MSTTRGAVHEDDMALDLAGLLRTLGGAMRWLLPLVLGQPFLRLYLLAEHGRCPMVANMFENTRTTFTNRIVRFLAWNMPYHAEHHAMPMVPFHALPALHAEVQTHLKSVSHGYVEFTADYARDLPR